MLTGEQIDNWENKDPQVGDLVTIKVSERVTAQGILKKYLPGGMMLLTDGSIGKLIRKERK